jgi:hypothetical protein
MDESIPTTAFLLHSLALALRKALPILFDFCTVFYNWAKEHMIMSIPTAAFLLHSALE